MERLLSANDSPVVISVRVVVVVGVVEGCIRLKLRQVQ